MLDEVFRGELGLPKLIKRLGISGEAPQSLHMCSAVRIERTTRDDKTASPNLSYAVGPRLAGRGGLGAARKRGSVGDINITSIPAADDLTCWRKQWMPRTPASAADLQKIQTASEKRCRKVHLQRTWRSSDIYYYRKRIHEAISPKATHDRCNITPSFIHLPARKNLAAC